MKKEIWILIVLTIIIIILGGFLLWPKPKQQTAEINSTPQPVAEIEVTMPKANDWISSPLKITGIVNGNGWAGFEGQVGTVKLLDNNGKELASGVLTATTEWTQLPTSFEANLEFNPRTSETGNLVFDNENPSGSPDKSKEFVLPIKFALGK